MVQDFKQNTTFRLNKVLRPCNILSMMIRDPMIGSLFLMHFSTLVEVDSVYVSRPQLDILHFEMDTVFFKRKKLEGKYRN